MNYPVSKRFFDVLFAGLGLLLLLPLGLLIALCVKLSDGGPVFYTQARIGQSGRPFRIRKFRSMVCHADTLGLPVTGGKDPRVTCLGRILRRCKLDELPQLWNVLAGEMALVGPRPEVPRYVEHYSASQREILRWRPGITDLATLLFRQEEELLRGAADVETFYLRHCLPRKIELNRQYAARACLAGDVWIILRTVCPGWLGVGVFCACLLSVSWVATLLLAGGFRAQPLDHLQSGWGLLLMAGPPLLLLGWSGQMRGLLPCFNLPELGRMAAALGVAALFQMGFGLVIHRLWTPDNGLVLIHLMVSFLLLSGIRLSLRLREESPGSWTRQDPLPVARVAIIGAGSLGRDLALHFKGRTGGGKKVVAFFDDAPCLWHKRVHEIPVAGMPECVLNRDWKGRLDEVIVALPGSAAGLARSQELAVLLENSGLDVLFLSPGPVLCGRPPKEFKTPLCSATLS